MNNVNDLLDKTIAMVDIGERIITIRFDDNTYLEIHADHSLDEAYITAYHQQHEVVGRAEREPA